MSYVFAESVEVFDGSQVTRDDKPERPGLVRNVRWGPQFSGSRERQIPWNTCRSGWEKPQHA